MAHDVVTFLAWAANPEMAQRKQIGVRGCCSSCHDRPDLRGEAQGLGRRALRPLSAADDASPVIGIIGGSGLYDIDGLEDKAWRQVEHALGHAVRRAAVRPARRRAVRVPAAAWARASAVARRI